MEKKWSKKSRKWTECEPPERQNSRCKRSADNPHKNNFSHNFQPAVSDRKQRKKKSSHSKQVGKHQFRQAEFSTSSTAVHASCSQEEQQGNELDIPGFYYDAEKKRYFKIAPNHCPNAVTRDVIRKKETEQQRQKDIKIFQEKKSRKEESPSTNSSITRKKLSEINITSLISKQKMGSVNSETLCNSMSRSQVTNLKPVSSQCLTESLSWSSTNYNRLEHTHLMLVNKNHDNLLCLWSLKDTWVQRMQLVKVKEKQRTSENIPISVNAEPHGKVIIQSLNKVTDICWATQVMNSAEEHVLYTTICHTGYMNSLAMIRSLSSEQEERPTFLDFDLGKRATWSCAWNRHRQQFSVGSEKCALILNVERRTMWEYYTNNSDPLTQVFSDQTGNCLHTGTRNGFVLTHDLRSRSTRPVCSLQHKSSVCSIKLLQNDVSVLASDFTGRICLWDLRNKKAVVEYTGHNNLYTKLPVYVDERERIVYSVGEDGYTRFWCLRLGSPLCTIPPPCPTSRETIPCVQFSMRWGDKLGNSGLIMALEDKLHYYGSLSVP